MTWDYYQTPMDQQVPDSAAVFSLQTERQPVLSSHD